MPNDDEATLLQQVKAGHRDSCTVLYHRYVNSLRSHLRACKRQTKEDTDDILQETFYRFFKTLPNFRHECSLSTWLSRIALGVLRDYVQKQQQEKKLVTIGSVEHENVTASECYSDSMEEKQDNVSCDLAYNAELLQQELHDFELQLDVERVFARLQQDQKKTSLFKCLEALIQQAHGYSTEEIATQLGKSNDATRKYLSECGNKLKEYGPIRRCWESFK